MKRSVSSSWLIPCVVGVMGIQTHSLAGQADLEREITRSDRLAPRLATDAQSCQNNATRVSAAQQALQREVAISSGDSASALKALVARVVAEHGQSITAEMEREVRMAVATGKPALPAGELLAAFNARVRTATEATFAAAAANEPMASVGGVIKEGIKIYFDPKDLNVCEHEWMEGYQRGISDGKRDAERAQREHASNRYDANHAERSDGHGRWSGSDPSLGRFEHSGNGRQVEH
jgi:hypothetical protein